MGELKGSEWYDACLDDPTSPHLLPAAQSPWWPLYQAAATFLNAYDDVVDLGCGTGRFAATVAGHVASYVGVDFSPAMIAEAERYVRERRPDTKATFVCADIADALAPPEFPAAVDPPVYVLLELLEHLRFDLGLLYGLPAGSRVIIGLPSRDSASHVRFFPHPAEVFNRYEHRVAFDTWERVKALTGNGWWHLLTGTIREDNT